MKLENWGDRELIAAGKRKRAARHAEVPALVDTGATKLYLKSSVIHALGLRKIGELTSQTMSNRFERHHVFSPVQATIQGRSGQYSVIEVPDALPNVVGQIPLADMDWVIDLKKRALVPNPDHKNGVMCDDF